MSDESKEPDPRSAKPMPAIERFRLLETDNPDLVGLGFETAIGSVLLAAHTHTVLEMIAKLQIAAGRMRKPS